MNDKTMPQKGGFWSTFFEPDLPIPPDQKHIPIFDILRALACFCVVLFHAAGGVSTIKNIQAQPTAWWAGNVYSGLAVNFLAPAFFIISGASLFRPHLITETIPAFLKKRARSILPPFLIASLLYYLYTHAANGRINLLSFFAVSLGEPQYYHLWFFYSLIGLYFIVPIFRPLFQPENRSRIRYLLLLWVIATGVIPLIQKFTSIRITIFPSMFSYYSGYFLFGAYFFNLREWNIKRSWAVGIILLMNLISLGGTYFLSTYAGRYDNFFSSQVGLNILLSTLCLISLFVRVDPAALPSRHPSLNKVVEMISRYSLYIYIFHPMVNEALVHFIPSLSVRGLNPFVRLPFVALLSVSIITLVCGVITWLKDHIRARMISRVPEN